MSFYAFVLILASVILHVGWNLLSKSKSPTIEFCLIVNGVAAVLTVPAIYLAHIDWASLSFLFWITFLISAIANLIYCSSLFAAYSHSDISLVYPVARALPVLLTVLFTMIFDIGQPPSTLAFAGMTIVFCGCMLMPINRWRDVNWETYASSALGLILLAALGTTCYTICDSKAIGLFFEAARLGNSGPGRIIIVSTAYLAMLECAITAGLLPVLFLPKTRRNFRKLCLHSWEPYASGLFTAAAYVLVLMAMPHVTNVSFVQAFRQMGLPLSVAAGTLILKEKCPPTRIFGVIIIVIGLIMAAYK